MSLRPLRFWNPSFGCSFWKENVSTNLLIETSLFTNFTAIYGRCLAISVYKRMITGAANADVAVLVIAAVTGEFEAGFTGGGQTKEHIMLARGLGVTQIIVAVNKLDVEGWKQNRYKEIQGIIKDFLLQQEFKPKRIQFVPISGLTGENVKTCKSSELSKWYKGPTLLEAINNYFPANRQLGMSVKR